MWRKFLREYRIYIILASLIVIFICVALISSATNSSLGKSDFATEVIYPWQKLVSKIADRTSAFWQNLVFFFSIKSDNDKLNKELSSMRSQSNELAEAVRENERLRALLDYKKKTKFKMKTAAVIGRDVNNDCSVSTIDLGERDGVVKDLPVVTDAGLVGKVLNAFQDTSQVLLITDYRSSISSIVQRTRCVGSVKGKGMDACEMKYISINDEVKVGDTVITSGDGKIFPKGIPIGDITSVSVSPDGMSYNVDIRPAVRMLKLEEVFVVIKN